MTIDELHIGDTIIFKENIGKYDDCNQYNQYVITKINDGGVRAVIHNGINWTWIQKSNLSNYIKLEDAIKEYPEEFIWVTW